MEDEETRRDRALASITIEDRGLVLAYAMLANLAEDLAQMRIRGHWHVDPLEMWAKPDAVEVFHTKVSYVSTHSLLREISSNATRMLYAIVAAGTHGRLKADRGMLVRLAKQQSANISERRAAITRREDVDGGAAWEARRSQRARERGNRARRSLNAHRERERSACCP